MTKTRTELLTATGLLAAALALGCSAPRAAAPKTTSVAPAPSHNPGDHNHTRGKMLLASDGTYNALLTAHLSSRDGHELDIFVEDKDGPFALTSKTLTATARGAAGEVRTISFECAPANERPASEAQGTCSHFVAKAPWLRVGENLRVDTTLPVGERAVPMVWRGFEAKAYAHHEE